MVQKEKSPAGLKPTASRVVSPEACAQPLLCYNNCLSCLPLIIFRQLNDCAVELFLSNGCTRFLVFADRQVRLNFAAHMTDCQPRLATGHPELSQITKLWQVRAKP